MTEAAGSPTRWVAEPLGCVEASFNWFALGCELGPHTGVPSPVLSNVLLEFTAGWPIGNRLAEKCIGQRHFMGWRAPSHDNDGNHHNSLYTDLTMSAAKSTWE